MAITQISGAYLSQGYTSHDARAVYRDPNGTLWALLYDTAAQGKRLRYSTDNGATWSSSGTAIGSTQTEDLCIDDDGAMHTIDQTNSVVTYRRWTLSGTTWSETHSFAIHNSNYLRVGCIDWRRVNATEIDVVCGHSYHAGGTTTSKWYITVLRVSSTGTVGLKMGVTTVRSISSGYEAYGAVVFGPDNAIYAAVGSANFTNIEMRKWPYDSTNDSYGPVATLATFGYTTQSATVTMFADSQRIGIAYRRTDQAHTLYLGEWTIATAAYTERSLATGVNNITAIRASAASDNDVRLIVRSDNYPRTVSYDRSAASFSAVTTRTTAYNIAGMTIRRHTDYSQVDYLWSDSGNNHTYHDLDSLNAAPNAPTLVTLGGVGDGGTTDLSGAEVADWTFSDPDSGDTQSSFAFRRKLSGAASYEYWNAGTSAWQSSEIYNALTTDNYSFPSGAWANGNTYNWSVRTKDAAGDAGPYATDFTVTGDNPPTVTVTAPSGTVASTSKPNVEWSFSDPDGDTQSQYEVKVFTDDQYLAGGFDPSTSTSTWSSGVITSSSGRSHTVGTELLNGETYRAYVRVKDSTDIWSSWAFSGFTMSLEQPAPPTVTVTAQPSQGRAKIDVQGRDNLLQTADANGSGSALSGMTKAGPDANGWYSYTSDADGAIARFYAPSGGVPPGTYAFRIELRNPGTSGVSLQLDLNDDEVTSHTVAAGATVTLTGTKTTNRTNLDVYRFLDLNLGASVTVDVRKVQVAPSDPGAWYRGGLAGLTTFRVERSLDGGLSWEAVRDADSVSHDGAATQQATVYDYEYPPDASVQYRAKTDAEV